MPHDHLQGIEILTKDGEMNVHAENLATGTSDEDLWVNGGVYTFLDTAEIINVVSDSLNDNGVTPNTGAHVVHIIGLDANFDVITEDVTLNGLTPVPTTQAFLRIWKAWVTKVGSNESNVGAITGAGAVTTTPNQFNIGVGIGSTKLSQFTVPKGYDCDMHEFHITTGKGDDATASLVANHWNPTRNEYEGWQVLETLATFEDQVRIDMHGFELHEKDKIKIIAKSGVASRPVYGGYRCKISRH